MQKDCFGTIKNMQIETYLRFHLITLNMAKIHQTTDKKVHELA